MSNLILATVTPPHTQCGIGWEEFQPGEKHFTHENALNHPLICKKHLKNWLASNPICPWCTTQINADSILTKKDKITSIIKNCDDSITDTMNLGLIRGLMLGSMAAVITTGVILHDCINHQEKYESMQITVGSQVVQTLGLTCMELTLCGGVGAMLGFAGGVINTARKIACTLLQPNRAYR